MDASQTPSPSLHRTFQQTIQITPADIDELDHVNNGTYVRWVQEVAVAHSSAVGFDYPAYRAIGGVFVLRRHEIDYLRSLQFGDDVVATTWIDAVKGAQCDRLMEFRSSSKGAVVAKSRTLWVFMSFERQRPVRIPEDIRVAFGFPGAQDSAHPTA